ncbi:hypothetical protein GLOIN_2v1838540, partial [Rhizophagus irregularis DAOM 181602=DAOM 197198]
ILENKFWLIWRTYTYGKIKNKPRVKENAQPASSSRAAEIIATSGQAPIQNLGGFAQFLGGTAFSSTSTLATSDIDSAVSNATQLALVLKRLSKRDPITKLKALEEFESYLKSKERNENELTGILNLWATFPPEKRVDVLVFGREKILSYITDIILYKTSETLNDDFKNNDDNNNLENNFKDDNYSENNDDDDNFENKNDDYDFKSNNNDNDFEDENVSSIPLQSET